MNITKEDLATIAELLCKWDEEPLGYWNDGSKHVTIGLKDGNWIDFRKDVDGTFTVTEGTGRPLISELMIEARAMGARGTEAQRARWINQ